MATAALPSTVRDQALGVIARRLGRTASVEERLEALGNAVAVALMIDLEEAFHILIDVDELLPNGTVGVMVGLAELRAMTLRPVREPATLIDLAKERARRARSEAPAEPNLRPVMTMAAPEPISAAEAIRWRRVVGLLAGTALTAGAFAGLVVFAVQAGWLS